MATRKTAKERQDPMAWWREARFGMFIHWGLYAVPAGTWKGERVPGIGEWIMHRKQIPLTEYRQLAKKLNPVKFDANAWAKLAKDAGMKYLVITAKHHDGFAMYDSPSSDYDIVDATPWGKDPMKALAKACAKTGIRLCFYYSQAQDWEHPNGARNTWDFDESKKDFRQYLDEKVKPQLQELLTQYGPIGLIWFDTPCTITREQSVELREFVHALQPACLVSGRVGHGAGDYGSLGDNQHPAGPVAGDWETPCTLNDTWGYKSYDRNWKSVDYLVTLLANCASKGVNYLLNVGPTREGIIPRPSIDRLHKVGDWMSTNGEAIYGTQASPYPYDFEWGCMTRKKGCLYLLLKQWPRGAFTLRGLRNRVKGVRVLGAEQADVSFTQSHARKDDEHLVQIRLPRRKPDKILSVVALDITGEADVVQLPMTQNGSSLLLPAHLAKLKAPKSVTVTQVGVVQGWSTTDTSLSWDFRVDDPGEYRVLVQSALNRDRPGLYGNHLMRVTVGRGSAKGEAGVKDMIMDPKVNLLHTAESDIGTLRIPKSGVHQLRLSAEKIDSKAAAGATVCGVRLVLED